MAWITFWNEVSKNRESGTSKGMHVGLEQVGEAHYAQSQLKLELRVVVLTV